MTYQFNRLLIIPLVFLFLFIALASVDAQTKRPILPYRFLIPEGYVGWVRIDFGVKDAAEFPIEDDYYILKFPDSGRLQTSLSNILISRREQYFYYSGSNKYRLELSSSRANCMVQEAFAGPDPNHPEEIRPYRYIFIGPKEAFEQYQNTAPNLRAVETDGYPKIGAQRWLSQSDLVRMNVKPNSE